MDISGFDNQESIVTSRKYALNIFNIEEDFTSVEDIEKSAEILTNLVHDGQKRKEMAEAGFKTWKQKYSWEKIALEYEKLYKALLK